MRYTYTGTRKLAITHVTYNRSGRIAEFGFRATDSRGRPARDPVAGHLGMMGGGLRSFGPLKAGKPYEQKVFINEWVCFDRPGRYTVKAYSGIVSQDPYGTGGVHYGPTVSLESEPLVLEITRPDQKRRLARIAEVRKRLRAGTWEERCEAMQELRFMADVRVIPDLLRGLRSPEANIPLYARFGLVSFSDMRPVRDAVVQAIKSTAVLSHGDIGDFAYLLTVAHLRERKMSAERLSPGFDPVYGRWREILTQRRGEQLGRLKGRDAYAERIKDLLERSPSSLADWRLLLKHLPAMSEEEKYRVGSTLESCREKALIPELRAIANNEGLKEWNLRCGAIEALHAMGDASYKEALFRDITSPKGKLYNVYKRLGDYKAKEVAQKLPD